jgi:hypothetical protein
LDRAHASADDDQAKLPFESNKDMIATAYLMESRKESEHDALDSNRRMVMA